MKRILALFLLLCLLLAGCSLRPPEETPLPSFSPPVPESPGMEPLSFLEPYRRPAGMEEDVPVLVNPRHDPSASTDALPPTEPSDFLPVSLLPEMAVPHVLGPAGTLRARTFLGYEGNDPVYGDVDGDGRTELVYWCYGPTSGLFTVGICVYGLERGWPILKGCSILNLSYTDALGLEADAGQVFFCCTPRHRNDKQGGYTEEEALRLPVTLEDGIVLLNGGELPKEMGLWSAGLVPETIGSSFSALRERIGDEALLELPDCLVWQRTGIQALDNDPAGKEIVQTCAAVSDNGVTVTGFVQYEKREGGVVCMQREGVKPIPPVEDPEALAVLTAEERDARLGSCHSWWSIGSGITRLYQFWLTEDGKLLTVISSDYAMFPDGSSAHAGLWDMTAGEKYFPLIMPFDSSEDASEPAPSGADAPDSPSADDTELVTVHQEEIPTRLENRALWERFLADVARGEECEVRLRMLYEGGEWDLVLGYDGERFHINDGAVGVYSYLIVDENRDPPAGAAWRRATHYLLSEDPDMTWEQYMARTLSSYAPPAEQLPAASSLFTVYDN